jgi:hypothetical protein
MPHRLRMGVGVAALLVVLVPHEARAEEPPTVTVTPSTGLVNGQTVIVSGRRFDVGGITRILQCPPEAGRQPDRHAAVTLCDLNNSVEVFPEAAGDVVPTPFTVHEVMFTSGVATDCTVRQCTIAIGQLGPGGNLLSATAPIRFGPATPGLTAYRRQPGVDATTFPEPVHHGQAPLDGLDQ